MPVSRHRQVGFFCILLILCCFLYPSSGFALAPTVALEKTQRLPLMQHLDVFSDDSGKLSINTVASRDFIARFTPFTSTDIPAATAATWLRFTLEADALQKLRQRSLFPLLSLGGPQAGPVQLYVPEFGESAWPESWTIVTSKQNAQFPLPISEFGTITCYLRLAAAPTLWFAPEITLRAAAAPLETPPTFFALLLGALSILTLLNLLLVALGRGESRFWLALYGSLVGVYAVQSPLPSPSGGIPFSSVWGMLSPGLALVLLPHIGRHILYSWMHSPKADYYFKMLSFVGAAIAIAPLIPGLAAATTLLPLWPVVSLLCIVPAIFCAQTNTAGAKRYILACLVSAVGPLSVVYPFSTATEAMLAAHLPLAGVTFGFMLLMPLVTLPATKPKVVQGSLTQKRADIIRHLSHDFRTPLTAISEILEKLSYSLPETAQKQLTTAQTATQNLSLLVDDLLDINRVMSGRLVLQNAPFDLHTVLKEAHDIIRVQAEQKGLGISWFMAPHLTVGYIGDANRLLQVILNLLGNAVRFSDSGEIKMSVGRVPDSVDAGHILFHITDNGSGIPLPNPYAVFDNFCLSPKTGSGNYNGSGTGLTMAREIIGLMGGVICIESAANSGTEISFTIRLGNAASLTAETQDSTHSPEAHKEIPLSPNRSQILVADDVASNRQLISFFLEGMPYTTVEAKDGQHAIDTYMHNPAGLILIDADMPVISGPECVKKIRHFEQKQKISAVPIIGLTSRENEVTQMHEAGCTAVLTKPLSRHRLRETIKTLAPVSTESVPESEDIPLDTHELTQTLVSSEITEHDVIFTNEDPPVDPPSLDTALIPLIPGLQINLADSLNEIETSLQQKNSQEVKNAANAISATADSFGLKSLERMAKCVERAAQANDLEAISALLPDLQNLLEKTQKALEDIHTLHTLMVTQNDK